MRPFAYSAPQSLDEALAALRPGTRPLAGGTDLVTLMNADLVAPERLVAVRTLLPQGVTADADGVTLGAATTLAALERDATIIDRYAALAQAAGLAASPQLRNMATIGGNLLQRPRCWYFRNARFHCWLKGGDDCPAREGENQRHAVFGESPCVAVHPSDPAAALLAFDAKVRIRSASSERSVSLDDFFAEPDAARRTETSLDTGELVTHIMLPTPAPGSRSVYLKAMDRGAFSFALVSVAVVLRLSDTRRIEHVRVVLGGVAPVPWRSAPAERALAGKAAETKGYVEAAEAALAHARPLAKNPWKVDLAKALLVRALEAAAAS